jgi:hypothetical protein
MIFQFLDSLVFGMSVDLKESQEHQELEKLQTLSVAIRSELGEYPIIFRLLTCHHWRTGKGGWRHNALLLRQNQVEIRFNPHCFRTNKSALFFYFTLRGCIVSRRKAYRGCCPGSGSGIEPGLRLVVTDCLLRQKNSFVKQWSLLGV